MHAVEDWRLTYPGTDFRFGSIESGVWFAQPPVVGTRAISNEDAPRPREDGTNMGVDFFEGRTVSFFLTLGAADRSDALKQIDLLERVWAADPVRKSPRAVAMLTADSGRVAFGRPRQFGYTPEWLHAGSPFVDATFKMLGEEWYGPEQVSYVSLVPEPDGGLIAPLAAPLMTTASSNHSQVFTVGGTLPTPIVVEIEGPITNPVVEIPGVLRFELNLTLAYDQKIVVDARPWERTVLRDGGSVAGSLTRSSTRLSKAVVPPGDHQLILRGASQDGTATASVRWRDAFKSY